MRPATCDLSVALLLSLVSACSVLFSGASDDDSGNESIDASPLPVIDSAPGAADAEPVTFDAGPPGDATPSDAFVSVCPVPDPASSASMFCNVSSGCAESNCCLYSVKSESATSCEHICADLAMDCVTAYGPTGSMACETTGQLLDCAATLSNRHCLCQS